MAADEDVRGALTLDQRFEPLAALVRDASPESIHRGAIASVDASGLSRGWVGDPSVPILLRSTAKPFQALAVVESGAAEAFSITAEEIAVMAGSHAGQQEHTRVVAGLLERCGVSPAESGLRTAGTHVLGQTRGDGGAGPPSRCSGRRIRAGGPSGAAGDSADHREAAGHAPGLARVGGGAAGRDDGFVGLDHRRRGVTFALRRYRRVRGPGRPPAARCRRLALRPPGGRCHARAGHGEERHAGPPGVGGGPDPVRHQADALTAGARGRQGRS